MTVDTFDSSNYEHFSDYVSDIKKERIESELCSLDKEFEGIFKRNGRELTMLNIEKFMNEWKEELKSRMNGFTFADWKCSWRLKKTIERTHTQSALYITDGEWEINSFGEFIEWLYQEHQQGDKFYIGGILDYHFV